MCHTAKLCSPMTAEFVHVRLLHLLALGEIMGEPRTDGDSPNNGKSFPKPSLELPADVGKDLHQTFPILKRPSPINCWFHCVKAFPSDRTWKSSWSAMKKVPPFLHCFRQFAPPTNAHVFDERTWLPSTMSACRYFLSPAPDVQEHKRSTPRCHHQGQYHTTFCASTSRWDTSQTSHSIQQSHSKFDVAIKRSACSRGLAVGLNNTSCCGVCSAQPHRKCGEGWPLPPRQAKKRESLF